MDEKFSRLEDKLDAVTKKETQLEKQLDIVSGKLETLVSQFVLETKAIAEQLTRLNNLLVTAQKENHEMIDTILGRKQVPISIFLIVTGMLSLILLSGQLSARRMDLEMSTSGFSIKQQVKELIKKEVDQKLKEEDEDLEMEPEIQELKERTRGKK